MNVKRNTKDENENARTGVRNNEILSHEDGIIMNKKNEKYP
jgi:hypothetical protein